MPLLLPPDNDLPRDDCAAPPDFWLEMPLISSISVPFQSAVGSSILSLPCAKDDTNHE